MSATTPATTAPRLGPDDLMRMMQGAQVTMILRGALELRLFDGLAGGPLDAAGVAAKIGGDVRATRILLDALAALGVVERDGARYRLTQVAADHLVSTQPHYLGDAARIFSSDHLVTSFGRLPEHVRAGGTQLDTHAETPEHPFWTDFARWSAAIAIPAAEMIAGLLAPFAAQRPDLEVLDVAAGSGFYGFTLAKHQPKAHVTTLDWANVLEVAMGNAERFGVRERVTPLAGDAFTVPLAGPYDVVVASHFFHHFSEEACLKVLRRFGEALKPGGRMVIHDFIAIDGPAAEPFPHLFSVTMLAWSKEGEAYGLDTYERLLAAAGFGKPSVHAAPGMPSRVLIAERLG